LTCIANVGGDELAETLAGDVQVSNICLLNRTLWDDYLIGTSTVFIFSQRLLVAKEVGSPYVKKKAALTMCLIVKKVRCQQGSRRFDFLCSSSHIIIRTLTHTSIINDEFTIIDPVRHYQR
jgi:hypothetical protein